MTSPSPLQTKQYEEVPIELGDEQISSVIRAIAGLGEVDTNIFWNQVLYHTTLMMFGYGLPVIQGGIRFRTLELVG